MVLDMTDKVFDYIRSSTKSSNESTLLTRDAVKNIHTWKDRLTQEEIHRVKEETKDIWTRFYSENDW